MLDLKFTDARVCDGLGNPIIDAEVGVIEGKIVAIDDSIGPARHTVTANGLLLAPGFVDIHTHYDAQITWDTALAPSPANGVTTVVIGNCGFTIAPCRPQHREIVLKDLTKVEGIPFVALQAGVEWRFETYAEYLDQIEAGGMVPNVACFAGHSSIRTYVMGDDARRRAATSDEVAEMCSVLGDAIDAGAIGFSTSQSEAHNGHGGLPVPSRLADDEEMQALANVLRDKQRGTFQITRSGVSRVADFGRIADTMQRPLQLTSIMTTPGFPELVDRDMHDVEQEVRKGHEIWAHVTPFPEIMQFTLRNPFPLEMIEAWKPAMEATDHDELKSVYADHEFRQRVKDELMTPVPFRFNGQWEVVEIVTTAGDNLANYRGRTIADIAAHEGSHPLDAMLDIALRDDLRTRFQAKTLNYEEEKVRPLLDHPNSVISLGDAGAHVTFFCQAGSGLYVLQRYVRERGDLRLEEAIRLLTSHPAATHRIPDRGRISIGAWADLVLLDPDKAGLAGNEIVYDLPGGGHRIDRAPLGIEGVWVNGRQVVDKGVMMDNAPRPGQLLREFAA